MDTINENMEAKNEIIEIDGEWYIPSLKNPIALLVWDKGHLYREEFPLYPHICGEKPLEDYLDNIHINDILIESRTDPYKIIAVALNPAGTELWVRCKQNPEWEAVDHIMITHKNGYFVHFIDTFYSYYDTDEDPMEYYWPWE